MATFPDVVRKQQFAVVPMWVHRRIVATRTRTMALAVYVELVGQYAGSTQDAEGLRVWPEIQQIADSMGVPKRNIERALTVLIDCGVVLKKRTVRRNQYWLPQEPPEEVAATLAEFQSATSGGLDSVQSATSGGSRTATSGGSQSATSGGLYNPVPLTQTQESLSRPPATPAPAAPAEPRPATDERETAAAPDKQPPADPASAVAAAWSAARGGYRNPMSEARIRGHAAGLLAAGWPVEQVVALAEDMARTQPAWTDLARHADHWQPPVAPAAVEEAERPWCGRCDEYDRTLAVFDEQGRESARPCPDCHPGAPAKPTAPAWCGACQDPSWRWIETPDGRETRCPDCNPQAARAAA